MTDTVIPKITANHPFNGKRRETPPELSAA